MLNKYGKLSCLICFSQNLEPSSQSKARSSEDWSMTILQLRIYNHSPADLLDFSSCRLPSTQILMDVVTYQIPILNLKRACICQQEVSKWYGTLGGHYCIKRLIKSGRRRYLSADILDLSGKDISSGDVIALQYIQSSLHSLGFVNFFGSNFWRGQNWPNNYFKCKVFLYLATGG